MHVAHLYLTALGIHDTQPELTAIVVKVTGIERMEPATHGVLANDLARTVFTVIVHHHLAIQLEVTTIVRQQGKGIDAIGRNIYITRNNQADITLSLSRNLHARSHEGAIYLGLVSPGAVGTLIVVPLSG